MKLKFKIILLFLPLLALLLIESNNAIMWWSLHTKSKLESSYTPQKKHLEKIHVNKTKSNSEITWINKKEIYYKNHMYDVRHVELSKDGYIIYVEKDDEETKMLSQLKKSSKQKKKSQRVKNQLIKVLKNDYFNLYNTSILSHLQNKIDSRYLLKFYSNYIPITTPPPQNFFSA